MKPKQEAEILMNAVLPVAEKMLKQYGEFYPYGGCMRLDGTIAHIGVTDPDVDHPRSKDLIYVLRTSLQEMAQAKQCTAAALVFAVGIGLPNSDRQSDAIQVCVEHVDGYSVEVFFPYQIVDGAVMYGDTFAQQGKHEVFDPNGEKEQPSSCQA